LLYTEDICRLVKDDTKPHNLRLPECFIAKQAFVLVHICLFCKGYLADLHLLLKKPPGNSTQALLVQFLHQTVAPDDLRSGCCGLNCHLKEKPFKMDSKNFKRILAFFFVIVLHSCNRNSQSEELKQADHGSTYELVKDWPQFPRGFELSQPGGLGIDTSQNIFVFHRPGRKWKLLDDQFPDSLISSNTILMIDRNTGKIKNAWGAHLFIMPHGLTVDRLNNVWVTDVGLHQVFKFSHEGKLLMKLGVASVPGDDSLHFNRPTDIAIADDGSFYVSDGYRNSRVIKFSKEGKYLFSWGKKGDGPGEFNIPHAIDLDDSGNVYVADRENRRIQEFDDNGRFEKEWKNKSLEKLYSVVIDRRNQHLFAVDYLIVMEMLPKGSNIIQFDRQGKIITQFGRAGSYDGPVCRYHDLVLDKEGNIYVGDILGNRIQKFKPGSH
jgi:sugar lactone lactonase YvrE